MKLDFDWKKIRGEYEINDTDEKLNDNLLADELHLYNKNFALSIKIRGSYEVRQGLTLYRDNSVNKEGLIILVRLQNKLSNLYYVKKHRQIILLPEKEIYKNVRLRKTSFAETDELCIHVNLDSGKFQLVNLK